MPRVYSKNLKLLIFAAKHGTKHTRRITMSRLHTAYVLPTYKSILKHYNYVLDTVVYSPDSARYSNKTSDCCRVEKIWPRSNITSAISRAFVCMKSKQTYYELCGDTDFYENHGNFRRNPPVSLAVLVTWPSYFEEWKVRKRIIFVNFILRSASNQSSQYFYF